MFLKHFISANMSIESSLCRLLSVNQVKPLGCSKGGCISQGRGYQSENGNVFVKFSNDQLAERMFIGEDESLRSIYYTNTIRCPKPLGVIKLSDGQWCLVSEYLELGGRRDLTQMAVDLARMHLENDRRLAQADASDGFVGGTVEHDDHDGSFATRRFGFDCDTSCGRLLQPNEWCEKWSEFFIRNRLQYQIDMLIEKGDRNIVQIWPELQQKADLLLSAHDREVIPSLVHGDLWGGNWGMADGQPVVFDASSSYSDSEFEQGIMDMFGGFDKSFWKQYHTLIPTRNGRSQRVLLYELYHHLNHWNHFGSSYKGSSISLIHQILNIK